MILDTFKYFIRILQIVVGEAINGMNGGIEEGDLKFIFSNPPTACGNCMYELVKREKDSVTIRVSLWFTNREKSSDAVLRLKCPNCDNIIDRRKLYKQSNFFNRHEF